MEPSITPEPRPHDSEQRRQTNQWALILHLSLLAGYIVPMAGLIVPIAIYLIKREELPGLVAHANVVFNWLISVIIYAVIFALLSLLVIGIPLLLMLAVLTVIFPIIGAIKASNGEVWRYPLSFSFFKTM
jgi:uncharacterized Tic20 family protein